MGSANNGRAGFKPGHYQEDDMFRVLLALLIGGFVAHRGYYSRKLAPPPGATVVERKESAAEKVLGLLALSALLSTAAYCLRPARMAWAGLPLPRPVRWLGVGTAAAGFALLQRSQQTLARNWSDTPRIMADQKLVTEGPYRHVRHPIYAAFLLILGSPLLLSANWFVGGTWLAMTALDVALRMRDEEAMMLARFGEPYRAYMERTGRLLPRR
jgi:protein-S-isoprenylcysteine O-methyltransferase Ste14